MERSFAAAADIASRLDLASLRDKTAVTVPLARKLLREDGGQPFPPVNVSGVK